MVSERALGSKVGSDGRRISARSDFFVFADSKKMSLEALDEDKNLRDAFIGNIINELLNAAVTKAEGVSVISRNRRLSEAENLVRNVNRTTSIVVQDWDNDNLVECRNGFVKGLQRSVSERVIRPQVPDENSNTSTLNRHSLDVNDKKDIKQKKKKRLSFSSIFHINKHKHKEHKIEEDSESYDTVSHTLPNFPIPLTKSRKYASALELGAQNSIMTKVEKPSLFKKLASIGDESSSFLKRSLSFRDVRKREKTPSREVRSEKKMQEWRQSLQSLVESDISVSYKDLSFINYDALNEFSYTEPVHLNPGTTENGFIGRTQSLREKGSPHLRKPVLYTRHTSITPDYRSSIGSIQDLVDSSAISLPSLHNATRDSNLEPHSPDLLADLPSNNDISGSGSRRFRESSVASEDGRQDNESFRSNSSGGSSTGSYVKLRRHNATRQKIRHPATFIGTRPRGEDHTIFSPKPVKIARESLNIEEERNPLQEGQEWRRFVGSIRRKVQRHASSSSSSTEHPASQTKGEQGSRKNSLTKADLLKKEKSEDKDKHKSNKQPLAKQKSIGLDGASKCDYFRALSFRDKAKSGSVKYVDSLVAPKPGDKGVRKSEKKDIKPNLSFSKCKSSSSSPKGREGLKQDDFLKATMRIFLVVSPPVGRMQVRSRSLNHLDSLEMRQSVVSTADSALKDSKSEPDCTRPVLPPPGALPSAKAASDNSAVAATQQQSQTSPRKHMLSRSQKSSSECFSVNFEVGDESTWDNELFFPAQRGITLHDSLAKLCELRNIDLSVCDARLQDKENNLESFISFSHDTANLVGRHVRITAKDHSNKKLQGSFHSNHSRKQSGSYRPRTSSFFSSSTEDQNVVSSTLSLHDSDQSKKQIKQRITAFFGNSKDTKYEALIEQLDRYSRHGPPQNVDYQQGQCESIDALYKLEDDWRDIISDYSDLNDRHQQQQTALWELIKTEVAYIKTLKVVTDLFLGCLRDLQTKNLFKEIDTEKLFSNITEILGANVIFWRNTLFPLVRDMRKYKRPSCLENMLEGFSKLDDTFKPYYKYCAEQSRCQHYCRENLESEVFTAYLTWCESQKDCNRLRLMDILVQPMQRLTKYGLLLKAILKNTDEDVEKESLRTMIKMVDDFVNNVNTSLKCRQDKERLKGIIARIESYDIVESKDDDIERILRREKSFTQLDLTRPMLGCPPERKRHLLLEGDLKLKDSGASKIEVHCFLLTDMLLVCKPSTKKGVATMRVIRQPYLVDHLVVQELTRETPSLAVIYRNEFDMAVSAFILQNNDVKKIKGWKEGIAKAQLLYAQAKQTSYIGDESLDAEYSLEYNLENDYHSLQLAPRSPMASSSRASRVSSLAHSHSGSVEMNDQSSAGSAKEPSRGVSIENENRTGSMSSDESLQQLPSDGKNSGSQKSSLKNRLFHKTPNTLSVQPVGSLGQSLPNLTLGSPNVGSGLCLNLQQNTLSVPGNKNGGQLLSPTHRGISYPPPSPTRGNLRRSLAISQSKNPPLIKTRQVNSACSVSSSQVPTSFDFDVPVIAGVSSEDYESFSRGQHRQAMKRSQRYHTAGLVDDIKKNDSRDASIHKRLSWNCTPQDQREPTEDQT